MEYYQCAIEDLYLETQRRGYTRTATRDQLGEALKKDDDSRGADATTVESRELGFFVPRQLNLSRTVEFGETVPAGKLVNEKIVYWTMNTFFPTLQLFFESGLSCTLDGGSLPNAVIGLDPQLRFRLTDCSYEEDGLITKTVRPDKFVLSNTGIAIKEAVVAQRVSVAVTRLEQAGRLPSSWHPSAKILKEEHIVIGLRLEGMSKMAYIWAKVRSPTGLNDKTWGDVRIAGLRKDIPHPSFDFPLRVIKPGGQVQQVMKSSLRQASSQGRPMPKDDTKPTSYNLLHG